ncbi:kinase-like domain-containing protein [Absidia repens]|uniref:Kinase-like domain-containing protein n=1 Tax=Absidia repens TaxID=90262 RepID=A0A1X2I3C7_9FUNG|nr:kinase-like domain-containing protein [Absidia repens]
MSPILSPGNRRRKEIGDYWLGKTLGKGSSGRVKLGVHKDTGQKVAVKIISKSHLHSNASVERSVKREIAVMKLIKHPNIINFIDVIDLPDATNLYLILEYIEGGELFEYLISCGKLTEKEARKYFQQIIFGLDYCHRHLICHRDLKPENLLLDNEKNIKICDFGMASLQPTGSLLETSCGSPHYASPEIGVPYNGSASDIWSCGVILYALLNGHLPFDDDNIHNLLKKVKEGKYSISKDIPTNARDLIEKILVTDPSKRFTMTEVQAHPWFKVDIPLTPCILPSPPSAGEIGKKLADEDEIDGRILATLQDLWTDLSSTQLIETLQNEEYNMQKVAYVLLQRYSANYWQKMRDDEIQAGIFFFVPPLFASSFPSSFIKLVIIYMISITNKTPTTRNHMCSDIFRKRGLFWFKRNDVKTGRTWK